MQVYRMGKQSGCNRYVMPGIRGSKKVDPSWAQNPGYFFEMQIGIGDVLQNIVTYAQSKTVVMERESLSIENACRSECIVCLDRFIDIKTGHMAEGGKVIGCFIARSCSNFQNVCIFRRSRPNELVKESSPAHVPRFGKIKALKQSVRMHHFTLQRARRFDTAGPNLQRLRFGVPEGGESGSGQIP